MEGSQDKGELPRIHAEIKTILNNIQERINAHDNRITGERVRMGECAYASFRDLKDDLM